MNPCAAAVLFGVSVAVGFTLTMLALYIGEHWDEWKEKK